MAYVFTPGEPLDAEVRRVFAEELEGAAAELSGETGKALAAAVHEARKGLKKARALLRLVRKPLGRRAELENGRLRHIARQLADLRDAGAMLETLDHLAAAGVAIPDRVRGAIERQKRAAERPRNLAVRLRAHAAALRAIAARARRWKFDETGLDLIAPGIERTYGQGRRALKRLRKHPGDETAHEWRKRVKEHWYHARLFSPALTGEMEGYDLLLDAMGEWLGDDHNIAVLRQRIAERPRVYGRHDAFTAAMTERQEMLRQTAISIGGRLYLDKRCRLAELGSRV